MTKRETSTLSIKMENLYAVTCVTVSVTWLINVLTNGKLQDDPRVIIQKTKRTVTKRKLSLQNFQQGKKKLKVRILFYTQEKRKKSPF